MPRRRGDVLGCAYREHPPGKGPTLWVNTPVRINCGAFRSSFRAYCWNPVSEQFAQSKMFLSLTTSFRGNQLLKALTSSFEACCRRKGPTSFLNKIGCVLGRPQQHAAPCRASPASPLQPSWGGAAGRGLYLAGS